MRPLLALVLTLAACKADPGTDVDTDTDEAVAPPGELQAGVARRRVPAPVGIGTAGNGPFGAPSSDSPFADIYPATQRLFGHPEMKAVAISRGPGHEVVFVRVDAVGVFSQLRTAIVHEVSARVGRDMDDAIVIGATHTHSGPGRIVNTGQPTGGFFDIIADKFFPEYYERFVHAAADVIVEAIEDLAPARLGSASAVCADAHNDRRCEDGEDYQNGALPMLAVEREGQIDALVMSYAIHGTVLGIDDLYLSQDVSGAIETAVEDTFDHPVEVLAFNAWGADMAPGDPAVTTRAAGVRDGSFDRMWRVGARLGEVVDAALGTLTWEDEPTIALETHRAVINREVIGYEDGVFNYPYGGVYCGSGAGDCENPRRFDEADKGCVPFVEAFPAPGQTDLTVGKVGAFSIVTWPGEPGTRLAESVMAQITAANPDAGEFFFMGYTQDYLGYSLLEDDYWHGGYETSGHIWGPRQGEYLIERVVEAYGRFSGVVPDAEPLLALEPFPYTIPSPYAAVTGLDAGTVAEAPAAEVAADGVVQLTVLGHDPWLGAPLLELVDGDGAVVTRPNGAGLNSDDQNFDVQLTVTPPWGEEAPDGRSFAWTFRLSPRSPLPAGIDLSGGTYTARVTMPTPGGSSETVDAGAFTVTAPAE